MTDVLFKIVAFALLTPMVSLLFRGFLWLSGNSVLADTDIAVFLLHPIGWLTLIIVGGAIVGVLALEQSVLMALSLAATQGRSLTVPGSLAFVAGKAKGVFRVTSRMVARVLLLATPFLAVGGVLFLLLLTEHDVNFYLSEKPPQFWLAVVLIGVVLIALAALIIRCVVSWSVAIQLHLFEDIPPGDCLKTSRQRVLGNRITITKWVVTWIVINSLIVSISSALVIWLGRHFVLYFSSQLWTLVLTLGVVLLLWGVANFATSLLSVISFALMQAEVYLRFGSKPEMVIPGIDENQQAWLLNWTRGRVVSAATLTIAVAGLIGSLALHTIHLEDNVQITAHRGASGKAPENTLASVRQAITDGTDWVEIDVQESKDGVVVVAHDSDLMKVAGVATKIWEATADELRAIDIGSYFGPEFADERVPTLEEVLLECRSRVRLNIELKYYGHTQNLEQKVVDLVEQCEMESEIVIMSLKRDGIQKIKTLRPDWTVGLLTAVAAGDLTRADADFLAVNSKLATRSFIRSAHKRDKQVYVWTINDPFTMSTMISRGVNNLITDNPHVARRVLRERAMMSPVERVLVELAVLFGVNPKGSYDQ